MTIHVTIETCKSAVEEVRALMSEESADAAQQACLAEHKLTSDKD